MAADPWLEPWLPALRLQAARGPVLELGCGTGRDTRTLIGAGFAVTAIDLSRRSLAVARLGAPRATFHRQDLRSPFPGGPASYGAVVASLVLHYFPWSETLQLVDRIRAALVPDGLLLCRLNSTNDVHFGAQGHSRIEENYYSVNGVPKRFFSKETALALFQSGWVVVHIEERVVHRYAQPKWVWEVVARSGV
jgi:SAM-dependent methyltransferase